MEKDAKFLVVLVLSLALIIGFQNVAGTNTEGQLALGSTMTPASINQFERVIEVVLEDTTAPTTTRILDGDLGEQGWYITPVTITLDASDDLSGVSKTVYTLDGITWEEYSGAFTLSDSGSYLLNYSSVDNAGNQERPHVIKIHIDVGLPSVNPTLSGEGLNGWFSDDVTVELEGIDDASGIFSVMYSYDDATWYIYESALVIFDEGMTTVYYYATDYAGNIGDSQWSEIKIDRVFPNTAIELDGIKGTGNEFVSDVTVTLTPLDTLSGINLTEYSFDELVWIEYDTSFVIDWGGITTVYYRSMDNAGNVEITNWVTIQIQKSPQNLHVDTFLSKSPFPTSSRWHLTSMDVFFVKKGRYGFKLLSKPSHFWFHIEVMNNWSVDIDELKVSPTIPIDFKLSKLIVWEQADCGCLKPVYFYMVRKWHEPLILIRCGTDAAHISFDGEVVSLDHLSIGKKVFFSIEVDYTLNRDRYQNIEDYTTESYLFSAIVDSIGQENPAADGSVIGSTTSETILEVVNHGVKGRWCRHAMHSWFKHMRFRFKFHWRWR
ncbi:MAG: OmpL47-type beta-barrel domain-containing protein [Candidatus Thorarchaeota archaeon]